MDLLAVLQRRIADSQAEPLNTTLLGDFIQAAKDYILTLRYPIGEFPKDKNGVVLFPERYEWLVVEMAIEMISKMGAEGQLEHDEAGIDRVYARALVSPELSAKVIPMATGI